MSNELRDLIKSSKYFYRDYFRALSTALGVCLALCFLLIIAIVYVYVDRPSPAVYASAGNGMLVLLQPIAGPSSS